eukprot:CAMPEP_0197177294 /NCGR_PEP_ID=MMETSP1423-20130617/2951_1 /TAXON_ID=476441 /ORGANISM="Pseudo-nitzschia heimii, Strain UNC1101" /LENGTH=353 /DNA_ID=CAMNT_0042626819 /DNA_START=173 /DNA_END=1231 /DNA_ORIENTATION=+
MFREDVLLHPQRKSRHPKKNDIFPTDLEILKQEATKLISRLGDGIEDVSFREFVDLMLATSGDALSSATQTERLPFPIDMYLLIERDIASETRSSSVLWNLYRCSLNSLHKIKDAPTEDVPTRSSLTMLAAESIDENGFPITAPSISDDVFEHIDGEDQHSNDRPPPMSPLSSVSTAGSCSTASWSTVSFTNCRIDDNYENSSSGIENDVVESPPECPLEIISSEETSLCQQNQQSTISVAPETETTLSKEWPTNNLVGKNFLSSFHFVSMDGDDSDETINDDEVEIGENNSTNGASCSDDSSMIVFVEGKGKIQDQGREQVSTGTQADEGRFRQTERSSLTTGIKEKKRKGW